MSKRKAYISSYQLGAFDAYHNVANFNFLEEDISVKSINFKAIILSSIIQNGIDKVIIPDINKFEYKKSSFLDNHIILKERDKDKIKIHKLVEETFLNYLPNDFDENNKNVDIYNLIYFIEDLLIATKKNTNLIWFLPLPKLSDYNNILPPELYYPINSLFNKMAIQNVQSPIPKKTISKKNIYKYQEVIESDIFNNFVDSYNRLQNLDNPKHKSISLINKYSLNLLKKFKNEINLEESIISLLPLTSELIKIIFGNIPGVIADYSLSIVENWQSNNRLVIHQYNQLSKEILKEQFRSLKK